jgi:hypothetical protein
MQTGGNCVQENDCCLGESPGAKRALTYATLAVRAMWTGTVHENRGEDEVQHSGGLGSCRCDRDAFMITNPRQTADPSTPLRSGRDDEFVFINSVTEQ